MKNKGSTGKKGFIKRLVNESLILSCLDKLSSRLVYFLKVSMLSFMLTGCAASDDALERGKIGNYIGERKLISRLARSVKRGFSGSVEESTLVALYRRTLSRALYTPVSTYGAFFITFGIYIVLVYFVKLYGFEMSISKSSLEVAVAMLLLSFPLLFSRKALVHFLGRSGFVSNLFSYCIDFSFYDGKKRSAAVGTAIIFGSVLGVLSFFSGEGRMLAFLFGALYILVVFHSPEMGLFSVALAFPFVSRVILSAMITVSFISYLIKVLRGKRNLRFGASGLFVSLLGVMFLFCWLRGGGEKALFAFCMCAVYILSSNLLSTPALLRKCVSALVLGFGISVLCFALQVFNHALHGEDVKVAVLSSFSVFSAGSVFASYALLMLPFMFCKSSRGGFISKIISYLTFVACIAFSVFMGHTVLAVLAAVCVTAYLSLSGRRIFRPLVLCFGLPVGGLYFANVSISYSGMGLYDIMASWTEMAAAASPNLFFGVGMSDASVALAFAGQSNNMYLQTFLECGLTGFILFALALAFALQRLYAKLSQVGTENRAITAAAGASALAGFVMGYGINLWQNIELCVVFWLCLGLASAAYRVRMEERRGTDECED